MTEIQAQLVNAVVGVSIGVACYWALGHFGAAERVLMVEALMTIVVPALGVGLVGRHYERKEIESEEAEARGDQRAN
jgi:uncharacterized membrane protein